MRWALEPVFGEGREGLAHRLRPGGRHFLLLPLLLPGGRAIRGHVALSKMFGYTTTLRSITQGRGQHNLEPFQYRRLPASELKRFQ